MTRFSFKDLLAATTLIAIGLMMILAVWNHPPQLGQDDWHRIQMPFILWFGGGAMFGAGVFKPFHKVAVGALLGLILQVILMALTLYYP